MVVKTAHEMAKEHRAISISEFFEKNRHLLGYDNKIKALLTIIKEAVDNALDATEEARVLPDIYVKIEELEKEKYKIVIRDNGPGIVKKQVANIFGKLLYGSKFHKLRQSRGQQGIGISGCVLYSQLTSGQPTQILTSTGDGKTHKYRIKIDVKHNEPMIEESQVIKTDKWHGVQVTFVAEGLYREHKQSVIEYLKQVAISNPYANIVFDSPTGKVEFSRGVQVLPKEPDEIKPHLYGVEIGILTRMLHDTKARTIQTFLTSEFSRIGSLTAKKICEDAKIDPRTSPRKLTEEDVKNISYAVKETKLTKPPTDCLSPLGNELIKNGLKKELNPEWVDAISRPPTVYRGWPFQIEVGIAYGGSVAEPSFMRFANKVPLLYQAGDCAITKSITKIDWRRYGLQGSKFPEAPVVIFVHLCSVWVPFTSESKESIASYPVIIKEIKLGLQDCARKLSLYLSGVRKAQMIAEKKRIFERYAGETAVALEELTGSPSKQIEENILKMVEKRWGEINGEEDTEEQRGEGQDRSQANTEHNG